MTRRSDAKSPAPPRTKSADDAAGNADCRKRRIGIFLLAALLLLGLGLARLWGGPDSVSKDLLISALAVTTALLGALATRRKRRSALQRRRDCARQLPLWIRLSLAGALVIGLLVLVAFNVPVQESLAGTDDGDWTPWVALALIAAGLPLLIVLRRRRGCGKEDGR